MPYDMPTNISRLSHLMTWGNSTVGGWAGNGLLLAIFIISFITTVQKTESGHAFAYSMIITSMMAIFFRIIGIVDTYVLFTCFILTGVSIVIISKERSYY